MISEPITVYCGNLPFTTKEADVRKLFSMFGNVLNINMYCQRGNFSGVAFVIMDTKENAQKAIDNLDHTIFGNRTMKVSYAQHKSNEGRGYSRPVIAPPPQNSRYRTYDRPPAVERPPVNPLPEATIPPPPLPKAPVDAGKSDVNPSSNYMPQNDAYRPKSSYAPSNNDYLPPNDFIPHKTTYPRQEDSYMPQNDAYQRQNDAYYQQSALRYPHQEQYRYDERYMPPPPPPPPQQPQYRYDAYDSRYPPQQDYYYGAQPPQPPTSDLQRRY